MIPSALSAQLQQGLGDFLRFSFWSSTPGMEHVVEDLLDEPGGLLKGPYVSLKLPFVSGKNPRFFPDIPLGFTPHAHQEQAFQRLGGRRKRSTLVATGTGSGKTESFLVPILDHCLQEASQPGVKAILIYPMNALATDQALRIARLIHGNDKLRGAVRAGLYIGESKGKKSAANKSMGPTSVITDREAMQLDPPDILLTNYKMLDYLLLRPKDQGVWRHNHRGTLRFLVVDEIHTFDGAQGTDLACLVRRLKRRLQVDDKSLCCVGTSATLGGPNAATELRTYAHQVFGEPFDAESVIGESRLTEDEFLGADVTTWTEEPSAADRVRLDPAHATDPEDWLHTQVELWLGEDHEAPDDDTWAVMLGKRLKQHATFRTLLKALRGRTVAVDDLAADLARARSEWREDPELARLVLSSLLGLAAAARSWRAELPEAREKREQDGDPRPVERFVDLRLQLWQRELRRMVASVEERPQLRHSDDLDREARRLHLPLVHCRECGAMGWTTRIDRDRPHILRVDLSALYRDFFSNDPRVQFLFPADAIDRNQGDWRKMAFPARVELDSLTILGPDDDADGDVIELMRVRNTRSTPKGEELKRDCPFCDAGDSLTLVGFRAATLTSVYIDQLFASRFNDDKKLLTFSDSVQDAAHRAGFFGARTWRTNLRVAMLQVIAEHDGLTVADLQQRLATDWRDRLDTPTWVSTFLAPSMAWLHDWGTFQKTGEIPEQDPDSSLKDARTLDELIKDRLAYEVQTEFGLQAHIGRSLIRTGSAAVALDSDRLDNAVETLLETVRNEVPGVRWLTADRLREFIVGLLTHLRTRGGILSRTLPFSYIESFGRDVHSFKRAGHLPGFGRTSRLPVMLVDRTGGRFDTWGGRTSTGWYSRWVEQCLGRGHAIAADAGSVYPVVLPGLVRAGLLRQAEGKKGEQIWGLEEQALRLTRTGQGVRCSDCGTRSYVAASELEVWDGLPCLTSKCPGTLGLDPTPERNYFGKLYATGDLERIFTAEHTGLLDRTARERVEVEFKAPPPGPDVNADDARKPWYPNLLSCTPTLEMGIDIGDLSTAILCSVPPRQSAYLQRIGRAGRRDGNSLVLTVANARPHDLYFFEAPEEMMEGEVDPPGVFLDAAAVLERQLTAFCFDLWVHTVGDAAVLPPMLRDVFAHLQEEGSNHFPFNLLAFIEAQQPRLLREFREMFAGAIGDETQAHLERFLIGTDDGSAGLRWNILETLHREQQQRDSLSSKARAIRNQMKQLKDNPAKALDWEEQHDRLGAEKDALLALVKGINRRMTLEFLTDEGLLPNYAFPESAVRLSSVIWRKKKKVPKEGSKYDTWTYEYARAPASAISELAPHADFYAGGRKVRIDQVDVSVSEVETWRFCDACNHAQRVDTGDEASSCPSCSSATWRDDGQKVRMLRLKQVFANAPDRESRIKDDKDDRRPRFFQRQILVDIHDEDRGGAWTIDDPRMPFGFEFLKRATFREVNFGDLTDEGSKTLVAGREAVRPGFEICTRCGQVQDPRKDEEQHSFACPSRKKEHASQIEECLYLYREFGSEALRVLLPMADLSTRQQLNSFVAALQAGLQARFGGSVDHLRTTVYSDPVPDSALRKQYLVLFDTVPGGTGYLKQLVTPQTKGGELPLFEAMQLALDRIEGCRCWNDPNRDGCYRCIYAFRNARDMDDTLASVASDLLRKILDGRDKLKEIESLGEISISGLMDSVLEVRFLEALRTISINGQTAKMKAAVVNKKPGYRWALGDAEWIVEPQVDVRLGRGAGIPVSIDFVLRPASARSDRRPIAVFMDGWEYHKNRIDQDLRQRMALLAAGEYDVWSFTWADLDEALFGSTSQGLAAVAIPDSDPMKDTFRNAGLAGFTKLASAPLFEVFQADLLTDVPWSHFSGALLASQMDVATVQDTKHWHGLCGRAAPPFVRKSLQGVVPRLAVHEAEVAPFLELMAVHDGQDVHLLVTLDDRPDNLSHAEFKASWRGYLRAFQLLRGVPDLWFTTTTGIAEHGHHYTVIAQLREVAPAAAWAAMDEVEGPFRALAEALAAASVPEPVIGIEIPDVRGNSWAEAEMVWEDARVAITSHDYTADARREPDPSWVVLYAEDLDDDPAPVLAALKQAGAL